MGFSDADVGLAPPQQQAGPQMLPQASQPLAPQQTPHLTAALQPQQPQQRGLSDEEVGLQSPGLISGALRSAAEGIPVVGGLLPKLEAGTNAALSYGLNPLFNEKDQLTGSFGDRYEQSLKQQLGMSKAFEEQHPVISTAAGLAGGIGTLSPLASTAIGARLLGLTARSLPGMITTGAAAGAGLSAADALARGGDPGEAAKVGAITGGALPVAGRVAGNLLTGARNFFGNAAAAGPQNVIDVAGSRVPLTSGQLTGDQATQMFENTARRGGLSPEAQRLTEAFDTGVQAPKVEQARQAIGLSFDPLSPQYGVPIAEDKNEMGRLVGNQVREQAAQSRARYQGLYDTGYNTPGEFHAGIFEGIGQKIKGDLTLSRTDPVIIDRGLTPVSANALDYIDSTISQMKVPNLADPFGAPNPENIVGINMQGVEQIRKNLVKLASQTQFGSPDQRAMRGIIGAFDNRVESGLSDGLFTGNADQALSSIQQARAAYREHAQAFKSEKGDWGVGAAMERIIGRNGQEGAAPEEIGRYIIGNGKTGANDLNRHLVPHLRNVLGENSAGWSAIRQGTWAELTEGGPQQVSKNINGFLDKWGQSTANVMFGAPEQALMRRYASLMDQLTPKPGAVNYSNTAPVLRMIADQTLRSIGALLGGYAAGPVGAVMGYGAKTAAEAVLERSAAGRVARSIYQSPQQQQLNQVFANQMARRAALLGRGVTGVPNQQ